MALIEIPQLFLRINTKGKALGRNYFEVLIGADYIRIKITTVTAAMLHQSDRKYAYVGNISIMCV